MDKDNLKESAIIKMQELEKNIAMVQEKLKNEKPEQIWSYRHGKSYQYCTITKDIATGEQKRTYIRKAKITGLKRAFQIEYLFKSLEVLKKNCKALNAFTNQYDCNKLIKAYEKMPQSKKQFVTPFIYDDKTFVEKWQAQDYERKPVSIDTVITLKKEAVRSKSEHIIANLLCQKNVPYHYEFPLKLKNGGILHPDFYCLNRRTRQVFYWEHFGMMANRDYANDFVQRLSQYSQNNIFPGKNLLITTESDTHPLNTRDVERLINTFLT